VVEHLNDLKFGIVPKGRRHFMGGASLFASLSVSSSDIAKVMPRIVTHDDSIMMIFTTGS
jgi:hypothetical protein